MAMPADSRTDTPSPPGGTFSPSSSSAGCHWFSTPLNDIKVRSPSGSTSAVTPAVIARLASTALCRSCLAMALRMISASYARGRRAGRFAPQCRAASGRWQYSAHSRRYSPLCCFSSISHPRCGRAYASAITSMTAAPSTVTGRGPVMFQDAGLTYSYALPLLPVVQQFFAIVVKIEPVFGIEFILQRRVACTRRAVPRRWPLPSPRWCLYHHRGWRTKSRSGLGPCRPAPPIAPPPERTHGAGACANKLINLLAGGVDARASCTVLKRQFNTSCQRGAEGGVFASCA